MAQLDFFLSEKERIAFVRFAFENGCTIVPDARHKKNEYKEDDNEESYFKNSNEIPLLFLLNRKYSQYPLEFDFIENENGNIFFIKQRYGGPSIDFFSPIIAEKKEKIVGPGYIGIFPYYYHKKEKFVPGKDLKYIYKLLTSFIRKISVKVVLLNRTYWVGKYAIEKARKGDIKFLPISGVDILKAIP